MVKLVGNICVYFRLPMSNLLHKLSFIFNVTQEQPIAIGIFTLLIVKNIKKECLKMFPKLWWNSICSNKYPEQPIAIVYIFWVHSILKFKNPSHFNTILTSSWFLLHQWRSWTRFQVPMKQICVLKSKISPRLIQISRKHFLG